MKCPSYILFKTLASEIRVRILLALKHKAMSVNELAAFLNEEQSKISHNLKKLTECRLLYVKQKGKQRIYILNKDAIQLLNLAERHAKKFCDSCRWI